MSNRDIVEEGETARSEPPREESPEGEREAEQAQSLVPPAAETQPPPQRTDAPIAPAPPTFTPEAESETAGTRLWLPVSAGPEEEPEPERSGIWKAWHTLATIAIVAVVVALGVYAAATSTLVTSKENLVFWTFAALVILLTAFVGILGHGFTGKVGGALIDGTKRRMSLSRLQVALWTILVIASYLTAFVVNVAVEKQNPLTVAIPAELLIAMGISVSSLIGTGIVLNYKESQENPGAPPAVTNELKARDVPFDARTGVLRAIRASDASWRDIFEGDTPQTATFLDLGKVQMFYITVALVLGYAIAVGDLFAGVTQDGVTQLPEIDQAFIALLAISHAGYLTTKAAS